MHITAILFAVFCVVCAVPTSFRDYMELSPKENSVSMMSEAKLAIMKTIPSSQLNKRTIITRVLEAVYYFDCPIAGKAWRAFRWSATFNQETGALALSIGHNVNHMGQIYTNGNDFASWWNGYLCHPVQHFLCSYIWTGKTEGRGDSAGLSLDLIKVSTNPVDLPSTSEKCIQANTETCQHMDHVPVHPCRTVRVDINVIQ